MARRRSQKEVEAELLRLTKRQAKAKGMTLKEFQAFVKAEAKRTGTQPTKSGIRRKK